MEHRRKALPLVDDDDFAGTHSSPTFGENLAGEELIALSPRGSRITYRYEVYDGLGDGASPVAPGSVTVTMQLLTLHRNRGKTTYGKGIVNTGVKPQERQIEFELPKQGLSFFRVTTIGSPSGAALWFYAEEVVDP